jgi:bifunctional UDP-N-acetylglucosamine pyrophosphorylase / glucosamine-1-phosphate N-acetyltransferase
VSALGGQHTRKYHPHVPAAAPTVVILAAGQGTRMRSKTPKVLHDLCGRPMVAWPIAAARNADAHAIIVVGGPDGALEGRLPDGVRLAVQAEPRGTGDAVLAASQHIDRDRAVIVLSGDVPLITSTAIRELADAHANTNAAATMATMTLDDPSGYGRVIRDPDGSVARVVETKAPGDATESERAVREVNAGVYAFDGGAVLDALAEVEPHNAQGEYYLPDALVVLRGQGHTVAAHVFADPDLMLGVNDRAGLAAVRQIAQRRIHDEHMRNGVTIVDPASTLIDVDVAIGADTIIEPSTFLRGATSVGEDSRIGPLTTLIDVAVGDGAHVRHSYLQSCQLADSVSVGPFAYVRPGTVMHDGSKAGTFVELKNSQIGAGTKIPHLSYIGDADVGEDSNLGAGTITANYDGRAKHRTQIGSGVRSSVHVSFVAPVTIGDRAVTGAGSVITDDVPPGALGIARERQTNVEGYAERGAAADRAADPDPDADPVAEDARKQKPRSV